MTAPVLTINVSEEELEEATRSAIKDILNLAFQRPTGAWNRSGPAYTLMSRRVEEWYTSFDFSPLIEKLAAQIVEDSLREAINKAIQARAGLVLGRMIAAGDLDAMIAAVVEQKMAQQGLLLDNNQAHRPGCEEGHS